MKDDPEEREEPEEPEEPEMPEACGSSRVDDCW